MQKIILASQSPRRKQLLQLAEMPFEVRTKETDESYPPGLLPEQIAIHIARNKALAVFNETDAEQNNKHPGLNLTHTPVVAADTIVVLNNEIIGKPAGRQAAINTLLKLSGKKHIVITGVAILYKEAEVTFAEVTEIEFYELNSEQIKFYVDKFKPFDKAGSYAIQEWIGVIGIKSVKGDIYNVIGLPVSRLLRELQKMDK